MNMIIFVWFLALAGSAFGWIFGFVAVEFCLGTQNIKSPQQVGRVGLLFSSLGAAALAIAGTLADGVGTGAMLALFCWVVSFFSVARYRENLRLVIRSQASSAPAVSRFLLFAFDSLDGDKDGLLTAQDLHKAAGAAEDADAEHLLREAAGAMEDIGHVTASRQEVVGCVSPVGGMPQVVRIDTYGINRADLQSYVDRLQTKYGKWL